MVNDGTRSKTYTDRAGLTLFLSTTLVNKCRDRKINIADTCEKTMEYLLEHGSTVEMIALAGIEADIRGIEAKIQHHRDDITTLEKVRATLEQRKLSQQSEINEIKRSLEISQEIKVLNQIILDSNFDLAMLKDLGKEHIEKLTSFGFEIDDQWLVRQSQRVKLMK